MERYLSYGRRFFTWFTSVFTCVILASALFIRIYSNPYLPFRLVVQSVVIAAVASLLNFLFVSEKPIRKRHMAIRTGVHFSLLLLGVSLCAWRFEWFAFGDAKSVATFMLLFLFVYALVWITSFIGDILDEKQINAGLKAYRLQHSPPDKGQ